MKASDEKFEQMLAKDTLQDVFPAVFKPKPRRKNGMLERKQRALENH
jgi:hypothetical protein